MTESSTNLSEQLTQQVEGLRAHNEKPGNYQPAHERFLGIHSGFIIDKGELRRPNLQVVEFGAGPYEAFKRRANIVTVRGGTYTAIDLDPKITADAQEKADSREKQPGTLHIRRGNSNEAIPNLGIAPESQDVAIINSVAANATPTECQTMLAELRSLQRQHPEDTFLAGSIPFLEGFIKNLPEGLPANFPIEGFKGNVLVILNALLALKPSGRLVYAHNEQNMMLAGIQQVRDLCEKMGITYDSMEIYDPWYNVLNLKDIALIRPSKYDMAVLTADKSATDTSGVFQEELE